MILNLIGNYKFKSKKIDLYLYFNYLQLIYINNYCVIYLMSSYTSLYRLANPDYYIEEKKKINELQKQKYRNDPVYRQKQLENSKKQNQLKKLKISS